MTLVLNYLKKVFSLQFLSYTTPAVAFALFTLGSLLVRKYSLGFGNTTFPEWDPDAALHLRRMEQVIGSGGTIPINSTDYYICYPRQHVYPYAPLMTILGVYSVWLFHAIFPNTDIPFDQIAGFVPPALGMIFNTILFIWVLNRSKSYGLACFVSLIFAVEPSLLSFWGFHQVDHHCLEGFFLWTWLIVASIFTKKPSNYIIWSTLGGILLLGLILGWTGMTRIFFLIVLFAGLAIFLETSWSKDFAKYIAGSSIIAAVLAMLILVKQNNYQYGILLFSWFQPTFILTVGLGLQLWSWTSQKKAGRKWVLLAFFVIGTLFTFIWRDTIKFGFEYVMSEHPFFKTIQEFAPLFSFSNISGKAITREIVSQIGFIILLLPLGIYLAHHKFLKNEGEIINCVGLGILLLGIYRVRYYRWLPFFVAIWLGGLGWEAFKFAYKLVQHLPLRWRFGLLGLMFCPFIMLYIGIAFEKDYTQNQGEIIPFINAMAWLQRNSPDPGGYFDQRVPDYGVLAFWDQGNGIAFFGKRPAICSNLILGLDNMAAAYSAYDDEEAYQHCVRMKAKYWLVCPLPRYVFTDLLPQLLATKFNNGAISFTKSGIDWKNLQPIEEKKTVYSRLNRFMGLGSSKEDGTGHFRLVYVSYRHYLESGHPYFRIFEVVPGARIEGTTIPNASVTCELPITLPLANKLKRSFIRRTKADSEGNFSFTVPYSTSSYEGGVHTHDYYSVFVKDGDKTLQATFSVTLDEVRNGKKITLTPNVWGEFKQK